MWNERVKVAQTEFELDRLLCNRVGGECGSSPTLVFIPIFIMITKRTRKQVQHISNNKSFIQL